MYGPKLLEQGWGLGKYLMNATSLPSAKPITN